MISSARVTISSLVILGMALCGGLLSTYLLILAFALRNAAMNPAVMCILETGKIGKIKVENTKNYVVFKLTRKQSHGRGLATLVRPGLDPVFISEGHYCHSARG